MLTIEEFSKNIIDKDYKKIVQDKYPDYLPAWPLIHGFKVVIFTFKSWIILIYKNNTPNIYSFSGGGELPQAIVGFDAIDCYNIHIARENIKRYASLGELSYVVMFNNDGNGIDVDAELSLLLKQHELLLRLTPMKIFLSHKSDDKKGLVRDYKQTLQLLGFDPWIDEDSMPAGTKLERGILQGFKESCAVVFFITENFTDENYLATEIDYAIARTREDKNFRIITIVFGENLEVPSLLHTYVWKNVKSQLEGLREILKALPLVVGPVSVR